MSDLRLVPFSYENSATVLSWRNSKRIRENMLDDSIIERLDHSAFLENLVLDGSRKYFLVELRGAPVAALYFTGLGGNEVTWGCYIGTERIIPGLFVALLIIAGRFSFSLPKTKVLRSEVAEHNISPIKLNQFLGIPETARRTRVTSSGKAVRFIEYQLKFDLFEFVLRKTRKIIPGSMKKLCEDCILER